MKICHLLGSIATYRFEIGVYDNTSLSFFIKKIWLYNLKFAVSRKKILALMPGFSEINHFVT